VPRNYPTIVAAAMQQQRARYVRAEAAQASLQQELANLIRFAERRIGMTGEIARAKYTLSVTLGEKS
jgi:hypothetical protein